MRLTSIDLGKHRDPAALVSLEAAGDRFQITRLAVLRKPAAFEPEPWPRTLERWIGPQGPDTITILDGTGPHREAALSISQAASLRGPVIILQIRAEAATSSDPRIVPVIKSDMIEAFLRALPRIKCPALDLQEELRLQLQNYRCTNPDREPHERPRYAAAAGFKDDLLMALAQAVHLAGSFRIPSRRPPAANGAPWPEW
jgi:hypothetical protein